MKKALYAVAVVGALSLAGVVSANHSWGGYHWARTATPFTLKLGDNVTPVWDSYLASASAEWNAVPTGVAKAVNTTVVAGATNPKNCRAVAGTVQVCNSKYGNNGWLGIAQIWINGSHITQGATKMNDTYFASAKYNTPAWRRLVMCQEIAHAFGLNHQDEAFSNVNLGSCMDYTNAPAGGVVGGFDYGPSNEHPNLHDYEQFAAIYAHTDTFNSYTAASAAAVRRMVAQALQSGDLSNASEWGRAVGHDIQGRANEFVRDLGHGNKVITHVYWADEQERE